MLKEKRDLVERIQQYLKKIVFNNKKQDAIIEYCYEGFQFPEDLISDYLRGHKEISMADIPTLYCIAAAIDKQSKSSLVKEFFTDIEIKELTGYKYEKEAAVLPLRFKMIPVTTDSWIGPIPARELVSLYQRQLISYNANTQRALKYVFRRGQSNYRIAVNKQAVTQIVELFQNGQYISNTLTLNIPMDADSIFAYNQSSMELVITKLKHFDILDGYHRLLAIFQLVNSDPDFDYPMELRITNYDENKAKQFIFQEDQKTKMKKVDSEAYNVFSPSTRVINKLNTDPLSNIQGMVTMDGQYISQPWFNHIVQSLFFRGVKREEGRKIVALVTQSLMDTFNAFTDFDSNYLVKKWSYKEILSVGYIAYQVYHGKSYSDIGNKIANLIGRMEKDNDIRLVPSRDVTVAVIKHIDSLIDSEE